MIKARDDAHKAIIHAQSLQRQNTRHQPYHVGQKVWLEGRHLQTSHPTFKLRAKCFGPFAVVCIVGKTSYQLELPPQWKIHDVFHASLLLPYQETLEHGHNFEEPPPDLIDGEPEWEVEAILGSRRQRHQLQYFVKWKGYSDAHNTWEPEENIHMPDLIDRFYLEQPTAIKVLEFEPANAVLHHPSMAEEEDYLCGPGASYYSDSDDAA
jgi:hypothetical protein